ncbi:MAG: hypothetical protein O2840_05065 [bacterium]|nr:hypothetical protein [bacterium]
MAWFRTLILHIRLLWSIGLFLTRVAIAELAERRLAFVSVVAVLLLGSIGLLQITKTLTATQTPPAPLELALQTEPKSETYRLSPAEAEEQLAYLLTLHAQQPTHKELQLHIAVLYETLGNTREAQRYFDQAVKNNRSTPEIIR